MTNRQPDNYYLNLGRVSFEYDIPVSNLLTLINYQDLKRITRGKEGDLERSFETVERYLRIRKK